MSITNPIDVLGDWMCSHADNKSNQPTTFWWPTRM
jgi:hypothetical protein